MKKITIIFLSLCIAFSVSAQDCQMVAMKVDIPAGISKHHFPSQALPISEAQKYFTYLADWDQSDLIIRIRFSKTGDEWTNWQVLKQDFRNPNTNASPLNLGDSDYSYFEWAVFNKGGEASKLTFNFFHPTEETIIADNSEFNFEISTCACPEPEIVPVAGSVTATTIVTLGVDKN